MSQRTINCRMCRGVRQTINGTHCGGCGTPVANAALPPQKPRKVADHGPCPMCRCRVSKEIEPGRFSCRDCMTVFEAADVGYLDTRPDRNAEKREQQRRFRRI